MVVHRTCPLISPMGYHLKNIILRNKVALNIILRFPVLSIDYSKGSLKLVVPSEEQSAFVIGIWQAWFNPVNAVPKLHTVAVMPLWLALVTFRGSNAHWMWHAVSFLLGLWSIASWLQSTASRLWHVYSPELLHAQESGWGAVKPQLNCLALPPL